jgi:hypothetical protein
VITRRVQKIHRASRSQLKQSLDSSDRPHFDAAFNALVESRYLVVDEDNARLYRLAEQPT